MQAEEVLAVIDLLTERDLRVWLDGGWGVDALLGEQHRQHSDVDLVIELDALPRVIATLADLGFAPVEDHAPTRVVLRAPDGREADLHPVTFAPDGTGWQHGAASDGSDCPYPVDGFGTGRILDRSVPCLSPELQLEHHLAYEPRDHDRADMARLSQRFGLALPDPY